MIASVAYLEELQKQAFLLTAAGLGVSFAILYNISKEIAAATYDEHKNFAVLINVVLGLISGTILSQVIRIGTVGKLGTLTKPTLALVGGFSAALVFKILNRLVESIGSLFAPDREDQADLAKQKAQGDIRDVKSTLAHDLVRLRGAADPDLPNELDKLISRLTSGGVSN